MLVGAIEPLAGSVRLDGADLRHWPTEELGKEVGYLPQHVELVDGTVAENIARFGVINDALVIEAAQRAGAHEMILRLPEGYATRLGETGCPLSAGEQQRIGLARAYYGKPALIVLDEPAYNLDDQNEKILLTAVRGLREAGSTIVVISRLVGLLHAADHLLMLNQGRVQLFKPHREFEPLLMPRLAAATDAPTRTTAAR
jgi:ABC-type protease/lipase transport system fused ATPase/permease subunit